MTRPLLLTVMRIEAAVVVVAAAGWLATEARLILRGDLPSRR